MLSSRQRFYPLLPALLVFAMGLTVTIFLFLSAREIERNQIDNSLRRRVDQGFAAVRDGFNNTEEGLLALNQLFVVNNNKVSREQFEAFTQPTLARHPYIQGFGFERVVVDSERASYEGKMRERDPAFSIYQLNQGKRQPVADKPEYLIVDYVSPLEKNAVAIGLELHNNQSVMEAARTARLSGAPVATDLFGLAQEQQTQQGFLVTIPVYQESKYEESNRKLYNSNAITAKIAGYTTAVFRPTDMVEKTLANNSLLQATNMTIIVYIGEIADDKHIIFRHGQDSGKKEKISLLSWLAPEHPQTITRSFDGAGKTWHLIVTTAPEFSLLHSSIALIILVTGNLLSLLLALYLRTQSTRAHQIENLIERRTAELSNANMLLIEDNAARKRAEHALRLRERAIVASTNAVVIASAEPPDFVIEYVNPAFERITGYASADIIGKNCTFLWGQDSEQEGMREIAASAREQREAHVIMRNYRKDGTPFWCEIYIAPVKNENGKVEHFVAIQYDITETREYQNKLEIQANQDSLTGLANRHLLHERLGQAINSAFYSSRPLWVAHLDLDNFKFVNDTMGHRVGDELLKKIALRLQATSHQSDTIARVGADEFILILPERLDTALAAEAVQQILDAIALPLLENGHEFFLTGSIGIAVYPENGNDTESLIKHAGIAMNRAKELGRNNLQFFSAEMNRRALERLQIEGDLRNARERKELILHYQPQVDLRSGMVVGMEALIRWKHRELGLVSPARFIGLAEETGLIVPIGEWVIRTACKQNMAWQQAGFGPLRIAVNLSARQFAQKDLVQSIAAILKETGLEPGWLEIELTESLVMTDVERAIGTLRDLNELGVKLSIDDFGTGYSSLSYLKRFPIDVLKIDQSFVRDITIDDDDAAIAVAIISLAHSLKLHVIAEGVETEAQLSFLRRNLCDQMQGYYFSRPIPAEDFTTLLESGKNLSL